MPRQVTGKSLQRPGSAKPLKRKSQKGRGLNALQIAESEHPEKVKVRQHRLGESYEDPEDPRSRTDANGRSSKRRKVSHDGEEAESESGSDLDGERWHVGVEDEDEDSDLDSDEAFGESDEDRFADFTFRGSKANAREHGQVSRKRSTADEEDIPLSIDDEWVESEEDEFGNEAVDLATALDINEDAEKEMPEKKPRQTYNAEDKTTEFDDDEAFDQTESSDEGSDHDSVLSISDQDEGDHDKLQSFVKLLSKKPQSEDQAIKGTVAVPSKISAADLLQYIKDPQQRKSLKILQNNEVRAPEAYKGGIPGRLAPPLARRQQDRLNRVAAYDESKKELGKWVDTVKHNRRAEHLMFPLVDPNSNVALSNRQLAPISQSEPMSALESKIQEILEESGMSGKRKRSADQEEQEFEELQEKELPLAEVQARRAELRKARDLMFREEIRAKRIKKIKSKAYRRVHRKERDRAYLRGRVEMVAEGLVDSEEEKETNDRRRAEERMGARHRESKWAKVVKANGRAAWDEDIRGSVNDLARRDDELRRRIEGKDVEGSNGSESESEPDGYDSEVDENDLENRLNALDSSAEGPPTSKLESMAFMKRAEAARKAANDAAIRDIRKQLHVNAGHDHEDDIEEELPTMGRQKFGGKTDPGNARPTQKAIERNEFEERLSEDEQRDSNEGNGITPPAPGFSSTLPPNINSTYQISQRKITQDSATVSARSLGSSKAPQLQQPKPILKPSAQAEQPLEHQTSPSDSSSPPPSPSQLTSPQLEPRTLSEAIFFGDDTLPATFEAEKHQDILDDERDQQPAEDTNGLPGWGSWTGSGISKKAQKRALHSQTNTAAKAKASRSLSIAQSRPDAALSNVIVSARTTKKNNKYLSPALPHPYENKAQYERSLRVPVGPEWRTKQDFQDGVKPRVLMKQGVIRALGKPVV